MSYISKPKVAHPNMPRNSLGLTARDYEGAVSTLCAGCGHDSVTAAIVQAVFELNVEPHMLAKMSGIGCSSKTPAYFVNHAHGFNSVHGRMPSVTTGASAANRTLTYIGVSGDGDSLSIGVGQFVHAIRRNLNMCYIIENNGVYGLTKGQFSASADIGSKPKKGLPNQQEPIDPVSTALSLGATYIARGFSGDKEQLVPLIQGALLHEGFSLVDVISPCVTFNDHEGSTKSYLYTRQHVTELAPVDFVQIQTEITADYTPGSTREVKMHNGNRVRFRKVHEDYDPTDLLGVMDYLDRHQKAGEVPTGLLYLKEDGQDMHAHNNTVGAPLYDYPFDKLCPGSQALNVLMEQFR